MTEASDVPFGLEVSKGLVAKFLLATVGFLGTIAFARILGPVAFGGFYLLLSLVQLAKLPVDGFAQASKKRFSEEEGDRSAIVGATVLLIASVTLLSIVGISLARARLISFTGLEQAPVLFLVLFVAISSFTPFQGVLAGTGRVSLTVWIDFFRSILTTPLQLLLVLLGYGAAGMAYGLSLATALSLPLTHYYLGTKPDIPSRKTIHDLWSYARHSTVSATLGRAYNRLDVLLLGFVLTPAAVGQYEVALKLTLPAVFLSEITGEGLMARVSNLRSKGQSVAVDVSNALAFSSIFAIPIFFGGIILSQPLVVTIYGGEYAAAAPLLIGLALFRIIKTQTDPLGQAVNGLDRPDLNVRISGITLLVNVVLGVFLVYQVGAVGVVVATVIAESVKYGWLAATVKRMAPDVSLFPRTLLEQVAAAILMGLVVIAARQVTPVKSWLHLGFLVGIGALVYGLSLLAISGTLRYTVISILRDAGFDVTAFNPLK